jgi:formate hydrogenlyase subunit 6/NADH:ubiquinone oxidoreductase subunit I
MSNGTPRIDRSACIRCFCCQEFCPKGAMRVQRSALARLLVRG